MKNENKTTVKEIVKGYKVFNPDWSCRDKQYTCPGKFEENIFPSVCNVGMHFCKKAADCFNYYSFKPENKVAEVVAYGTVEERGNKCCTDKLEIVREVPWHELLEIVNVGNGCTGLRNSGNYNSGNYNSDNYNSGNYNSGLRNSGDYNSGSCNSGDYNSGNYNSGNYNSGNYNSGDYNSGDWNKCNFSNGCFNTIQPKINMFNKSTDWTIDDWYNSNAVRIMNDMPYNKLRWICTDNMTDAEKEKHIEHETTGGYLKYVVCTREEKQKWWDNLLEEDKNAIKSLPNFDAEIFKEITEIEVK